MIYSLSSKTPGDPSSHKSMDDNKVSNVGAKRSFAKDFPCGPAALKLHLEAFSYLCIYKQYALHLIGNSLFFDDQIRWKFLGLFLSQRFQVMLKLLQR